MSAYEYELDTLFSNIKYKLAHKCDITEKLDECHTRGLAIVTELLDKNDIADRGKDVLFKRIHELEREVEGTHALNEKQAGMIKQAREDIQGLEKDKETLTTVMNALAGVVARGIEVAVTKQGGGS